MTVRELIIKLLDNNLDGLVTIQYPHKDDTVLDLGKTINYSAYREAQEFDIVQCSYGIILGVSDENK